MDVIKKWMGWLLFIAMILFFVAMWQSGALDGILPNVKTPSVDFK